MSHRGTYSLNKLQRFFVTTFAYLVFGLPLGAMGATIGVGTSVLVSKISQAGSLPLASMTLENVGGFFAAFFIMLGAAISLSFFIGWLQALVGGLVMASWEAVFSTLPYFLAFVTALMTWYLMPMLKFMSPIVRPVGLEVDADELFFLPVHIFAALATTGLIRFIRHVDKPYSRQE